MSNPTPSLMQTYSRQPVVFARGSGCWLWDEYGIEYLDAISGVAVTNLGHSHPAITAAISEQASTLMHTSNMFGIRWQERLGQKLCELTGMDAAFFCNSGAEANESALKLAKLFATTKGIVTPKILVMENSFHGRTLATLAATGNPAVHRGFEPLMPGFVRVPFNDIAAVKLAADDKNIVAVLVEPVQGEGGVNAASAEYFQELRQLCNRHDWLMMIDEVQTGMGRTGAWFGFQHAHIKPDVITLAKGLGNGYPIGACLAAGKAASLFSPGSHGSTFGGNPLACRVACTVIDVMTDSNIPANARAMGSRLLEGLQVALKRIPGVVRISGMGLMIGVEMDKPCGHLVRQALIQENMLISVTRDTTVRLLPALTSSPHEVDQIISRLERLLSH
ncbi:hypothetical protein ALP05_02974 [Pseudomonas caricapapayae]|uniref:Acetylornithine aminotransferase n=1 Tax=Pseudomonas caricapapayae TaxID=46678 RepID=A0A3M6EJN6_9PSED|nr:aspartate aminotransferase family protein [Pseudomonas caricapapayae]RMV68016.1 hypothetical protein ALP05_02974 [Pseudomonas caricapapayae]